MMRTDLENAISTSSTVGDARRTQMLADALADIQHATPKHGIIVVDSEADGTAILAQLKTNAEAAGLFTNQRSVLHVHDADPATEDEPTFLVYWEYFVGCPPSEVDHDVEIYYDHVHWENLIQTMLDERPEALTGP